MGPIGWVILTITGLTALIIANWDTVTQWTTQAWDWVWQKVQSAVGLVMAGVGWLAAVPGMVAGYFGDAKDAAVRKAMALVTWMSGLGTRISSAVGNLRDLLVGKGMDVVRGLWSGIQSMGSWLRETLIGWAKNLIPGPIAEALGIASPSRVLADQVGRHIPTGVVAGIVQASPQLDAALRTLVRPELAAPSAPLTTGMAPLMGAAAAGSPLRVVIDVRGADEDLKKLFRKIVRVDGRGSAQTAFGRG
jgi:hypothetical protein